MSVGVVIVTHNSEKYLSKAIEHLQAQTYPVEIVIIDSGSKDPSYVNAYRSIAKVRILARNAGFCDGNNEGFKELDTDYILFLNPDAFISSTFIEEAVQFMKQTPDAGAVTGKILGYCLREGPTGLYDTTGIFHTWFGKWFDRGQGEEVESNLYDQMECIPAICGAVMFCRSKALIQVSRHNQIFNPDFFMYKEDIDLSLRMRGRGWHLYYVPQLQAYHCRGWTDRKAMAKKLRLCSARNEIRVNKWKPHHLAYSVTKYLAVRLLNL